MKIIALEFSSSRRSAAVAVGEPNQDPRVLGEICQPPGSKTGPISLIEQLLREIQSEREEIGCLVIGIGPGSYAGIRTTIATAQGWRLAWPVKLLGLSSAGAIAAQAAAEGLIGPFQVAIDAQRGEFYLSSYDVAAGAAGTISPLRLAAHGVVRKELEAGNTVLGPELRRWFPDGRDCFPHAAALAKLAFRRSDFVEGESLEPIYLRETNFVKAPPAKVVSW